MRFCRRMVLLTCFLLTVAFPPVVQAGWEQVGRPFFIEPVSLNEPGKWRLKTGLRYEGNRVLATDSGGNETGYDNLRVAPVRLGYGLVKTLEVGARVGYSKNSADDGFPDEGGLEGIELYGKTRWHRYFATYLGFNFTADNQVLPHGSDGVDVELTMPVAFPLGGGTFHGELGGVIKNGDVRNSSGNAVGEWEPSYKFGLGYVMPLNPSMSFTTEVVGQTSPLELDSGDEVEDLLELVVGPTVRMSQGARLSPHLSVGLLDGSPELAVGLQFETYFGSERPRSLFAADQNTTPRYSEKPPVVRSPTRQPPRGDAPDQPGGDKATRPDNGAEDRVQRLVRRGEQAYRKGNYRGAIRHFRQAARMDPDNPDIAFNLASLYYRSGQYNQALNYYRRSVRLDPEDHRAHLYLGATYYHLDRTTLARRHLSRARELDSDNQRVKRWLDRL